MARKEDAGPDIRPGQRVRNVRTGQFGEVAKERNDRSTRWAIMVHILKPTGGRSNKTVPWRIKDIQSAAGAS